MRITLDIDANIGEIINKMIEVDSGLYMTALTWVYSDSEKSVFTSPALDYLIRTKSTKELCELLGKER